MALCIDESSRGSLTGLISVLLRNTMFIFSPMNPLGSNAPKSMKIVYANGKWGHATALGWATGRLPLFGSPEGLRGGSRL